LLGAEDHHISEIAAFRSDGGVIWRGIFAEDAAGGKGGFDGADDEAG
jgi:hypothetical protein